MAGSLPDLRIPRRESCFETALYRFKAKYLTIQGNTDQKTPTSSFLQENMA